VRDERGINGGLCLMGVYTVGVLVGGNCCCDLRGRRVFIESSKWMVLVVHKFMIGGV